MVEILQLLGSSSFLLTPGEKDMAGPLRPLIDQYLATDKVTAEDREHAHAAWRDAVALSIAWGRRQGLRRQGPPRVADVGAAPIH